IGIQPNTGIILIVGANLWAASTSYSIFIVMRYAKKEKADKGSTILSLLEQEDMEKTYGLAASKEMPFTNRHKKILMVF
ncbi:YfcC family protein, partial [Enterococcus faecalis]